MCLVLQTQWRGGSSRTLAMCAAHWFFFGVVMGSTKIIEPISLSEKRILLWRMIDKTFIVFLVWRWTVMMQWWYSDGVMMVMMYSSCNDYGISPCLWFFSLRFQIFLSAPPLCPASLFELMMCCWSRDISDRPSFNCIYQAMRPQANPWTNHRKSICHLIAWFPVEGWVWAWALSPSLNVSLATPCGGRGTRRRDDPALM